MSAAEPLNRAQLREAQRETTGFKPERKGYRLRFQGTDLDGLVVTMRGMAIGMFLEIAELSDINPERFTKDDLPMIRRLFELVAEHLMDWNLLADDDEPVPATLAGILTQEVPLVFTVVEQWMKAVGDVPGPLPQTSTDGRPLAVAQLPMDPR